MKKDHYIIHLSKNITNSWLLATYQNYDSNSRLKLWNATGAERYLFIATLESITSADEVWE
jgi:hypothetical protein